MTTVATHTDKWVPELNFGARLALVRHRMGWNIKEAAAACGLPAQSWRGWEVNGHLPRRYVEIAKTISGTTGCEFLWLVHGPDLGEGGGGIHTREYSPVRVIATAGEARPSTARPVRRTRPAQGRRARTADLAAA